MMNNLLHILKLTVLMILISFTSIFSQQNLSDKQLDSIEYARGIKKFPKFKLHILAGGLFSGIDGSIVANNIVLGTGTKLDFEDNLKLDKYITTYRVGAIYDLNDKSSFSANFFVLNRSSTVTLKDSVSFGEYKFDANAKFDFEFDFTYFGLNYTYNFVSKPQFKTGATAGIRLFNIKALGSGNVSANSETTVKSSEEKILAPGVLLGLNYSVYFLPRLLNRSSIEYFSAKFGSITATLAEAKLGFEYYLFKNFGLGLMGFVNVIKVESDSQEDFNGQVNFNFKGVSFYMIARF
jgi:hypothetical protein